MNFTTDKKNGIKIKDNIQKDSLYLEVFKKDINNIWNNIDKELSLLKN